MYQANINEFFQSLEEYRQQRNEQQCEPDYSYKQLYNGKPVRSRTACLLLYPQNELHYEAIKRVVDLGFNYAMILHDSDKKEKEESEFEFADDEDEDDTSPFKKAHVHVVLYFHEAKTNTSVAKMLHVSSNYCKMFNDLGSRLLYLIHKDNLDKFQYNPDKVYGPLKVKIAPLLNDIRVCEDRGSLVEDILDWISNTQYSLDWNRLFRHCRKMGVAHVLIDSRYTRIIDSALREHNYILDIQEKEKRELLQAKSKAEFFLEQGFVVMSKEDYEKLPPKFKKAFESERSLL